MGEPVDRVADDLDVRDRGHRARGPGRPARAAARRPRRARRRRPAARPPRPARPARSRSRSTRSSIAVVAGERVAPAGALAHEQHARRPAGPPHLCAERGQRATSRRAAAAGPPTAQASTNSGTPSAAAAEPRRPAGGCRPRGWRPGRRRTPAGAAPRPAAPTVDPARARSTGDARAAAASPPTAAGVQHRGVLDGGVHEPAPTRRGRASRPSTPRCTAVGARGGEGHLVGADAERLGDDLAGVVEQQPGAPRPARCSRRGSAHPCVERGQQRLAGGRVQRLGRRRRRGRPRTGAPRGLRHGPNVIVATADRR